MHTYLYIIVIYFKVYVQQEGKCTTLLIRIVSNKFFETLLEMKEIKTKIYQKTKKKIGIIYFNRS